MNEGDDVDEIDPRKVRIGMLMVGAMTVVAVALLIVVSDPVGRFIFGFVGVVGLIQTFRIRRRLKSAG